MALTNAKMYNILSFLVKEDRDGRVKIPDFNRLLGMYNREFFDYYKERYEVNQTATDALAPFKKTEYYNTVYSTSLSTTGVKLTGFLPYPFRYARYSEMYVIDGDNIYDFEQLRDMEFGARLKTTIIKPTSKNPVCNLRNNGIVIRPYTDKPIELLYLRYPREPFLDAYVADDYNQVLLEEGERVWLYADEETIGGTAGSGSISTSAIPYTSKTKEMEWKDEQKIDILYRLLGAYGLSINKQMVIEYSGIKQNR